MIPTFPVTSAPYACVVGLLAAALTINVIVNRVRAKTDAGDGGVPALAQAIRAHANFAEQAPLTLLLIVLGEGLGARPPVVNILGVLLVATRLASAVALNRSLGQSPLRQFGGGFSVLLLVAASAVIVLALAGVR